MRASTFCLIWTPLAAFAARIPRQDGQPLHFSVSGGANGCMGQIPDGQTRVDGSLGPATFYLNGKGQLTDSAGRGCLLTPPTHQFQCDAGNKNPTPGFSISGSGQLQYQGNPTFYACPATDTTFNIYTQPVEAQTKCVKVIISTNDQDCGGSGTPSSPASSAPSPSSTPASPASSPVTSTPSPAVPPSTPISSNAPTPSTGSAPNYSSSSVAPPPPPPPPTSPSSSPSSGTASPSPPPPPPASTPCSTGQSTSSAPSVPPPPPPPPPPATSQTSASPSSAASQSSPNSQPPPAATPPCSSGQNTPSAPAPNTSGPSGSAPSAPASSAPAPSAPAPPPSPETSPCSSDQSTPSIPAPSGPASSVPASSAPTPPQSPETSPCSSDQNTPSTPAPSTSTPSMPVPSIPAPSSPAPSASSGTSPCLSSQTVPNGSAPSPSAPGSGSGSGSSLGPSPSSANSPNTQPGSYPSPSISACPASLAGEYQAPHLIIPVSSTQPDVAFGTQYVATINSTTSSILTFDFPRSYAGKTCSVVFLFPFKSQLQTSNYGFSGSGLLSFSHLVGVGHLQTTWNNVPPRTGPVGAIAIQPGENYVVASGPCPAGKVGSIELSSQQGLDLWFFQDYNPSPLGCYITAC